MPKHPSPGFHSGRFQSGWGRRSRSAAAILALIAPLAACQTTGPGELVDELRVPPLSIASPREMMGKDGAALQAALGKPALLRAEDPAQVWQYRGTSCVLDFFLYDEGGRATVTHIEARKRTGGGNARPDLCLHDVHRARYVTRSAGV